MVQTTGYGKKFFAIRRVHGIKFSDLEKVISKSKELTKLIENIERKYKNDKQLHKAKYIEWGAHPVRDPYYVYLGRVRFIG